MIIPPFSFISSYGWGVTIKQISFSFLIYSYIGATIVVLAFGIFLLIKAKKLSSFYLLLLCVAFALFSLIDFVAWVPYTTTAMVSWATVDIFSTAFFIFSYWFLYSFIKEHDLPMWQKVASVGTLIPTLVITAMGININTWLVPIGIAVDNATNANYLSCLEIFFILLIVVFTVVEYRKAIDTVNKKKIALAGAGVVAFLFTFFFSYVIVNFVIAINLWDLASTSYIYNLSPYAIFGMPILLAFLGYLIAKYQAFDVKLIKSIVYMVILMVLLFIGLFFA